MNEPLHPEVAILNAAVELPPAERTAYLAEACNGDTDLRQRVQDLLHAHEQAAGFMEGPPSGLNFKRTEVVNLRLTEKAGDKIGRYKLLQQIGEGGCGVVYMAEQEEPVRRRVALKVIKLGMDTKQVIARFEAERQALALMDHPNIAKVLDAGATEAGRPYFVMELVRGTKITDFCDENKLSTADRLKLFIQVCQAIQHAHQKGIIHRDIKPSNILVTINDGVPVPKVIDFGIAKATQGRLTDQTLFTAFEQFIGTPAYMSPEQAVMTSLDIDTRSDIYSLGVLLYELLTGTTPFDAKELLSAGLDEMRRTIREKEPPKPSTRLTQELVAADARKLHSKPEIREPESEEEIRASSRRLLQIKELIHALRGDLDWIAMKCLEKDRARRYETANGLAMDIERHLRDEPIVARPASALYRLQKSVRRNKTAFAAATAIAVVLVIGLVVSTLEAVRATRAEREQARQRQIAQQAQADEARQRHQADQARIRAETDEKKAESEASKSRQVAQFLKDMLESVDPSVALGRDTTLLRTILDKTAGRVGKDLTNQPEVMAELRTTLGEVYRQLGEYQKAEELQRQALAVRKRLLGDEHPLVAASLFKLALVLNARGEHAEAESLYREALAIQRKLLGNDNSDVAATLDSLAVVIEREGRLAEAESMLREALAMRRKLLGNKHWAVAQSARNLVSVIRTEGKLEEAESLAREALATERTVRGDEAPAVALSLSSLANVLRDENRLAEAETMHREALAMRKRLLGADHPSVTQSLEFLGHVLQRQGKLAELESVYREMLALQKKRFGSENKVVAASLLFLADVLIDQGRRDEAEPLYRDALAIGRKLRGNEHPDVAVVLAHLAVLLQRERRLTEAETMNREALAIWKKSLGDKRPYDARTLNIMAELLRDDGEFAESESLFREALRLRRKVRGNEHPETIESLNGLIDLLKREGKLAEATELLESQTNTPAEQKSAPP